MLLMCPRTVLSTKKTAYCRVSAGRLFGVTIRPEAVAGPPSRAARGAGSSGTAERTNETEGGTRAPDRIPRGGRQRPRGRQVGEEGDRVDHQQDEKPEGEG